MHTILRSYHTRTTSEWTMPEAFVLREISGFLRSARYHEHFSSSAAVGAFHCCQATLVVCCCPWPRSLGTASRDFHFFLSPCVEHQPGHHRTRSLSFLQPSHHERTHTFISRSFSRALRPGSAARARPGARAEAGREHPRADGAGCEFHALSVCLCLSACHSFRNLREQPDEQHAHPPTLLAPLVLSAALLCGRACFLAFERAGRGKGGVEKGQRARGRLRLIA